MSTTRSKAAQLARDTVAILREGRYSTPAGARVEIADALRRAVEGTVSYPPDAALLPAPARDAPTRIEVVNESTLAAGRRLAAEGFRVVALNFASARHPGGGFLNGARAQEESLCRSSGLYACLDGNPMYAFHVGQRGGLYTNYAVYSPGVPVIRADDGELLAEPYQCAFITAPAVNAGAVGATEHGLILGEMERRVSKVLSIAAGHGHDAAVLGAWGCGVFRNDPAMIAGLFHAALTGPFRGAFARVAFAVLDPSGGRDVIGPFERLFGGPGPASG
jgi:uncharacterized protein (TIGR02452 family)